MASRLTCVFVMVLVVLGAPLALFGQAGNYTYAFPKFTSDAGVDVVVGNFSVEMASVDFDFYREDGSRPGLIYSLSLVHGAEVRLRPSDMGLSNFKGALQVRSNAPINVFQTLPVDSATGAVETVAPVPGGGNVVIPFGPGETGNFELSLFNPNTGDLPTTVSFMAPDGTAIETLDIVLPAHGSIHRTFYGFQSTFLNPRPIAYLSLITRQNILSGDRPIHALATLDHYSARSERVHAFLEDPAVVAGVPVTAGATQLTFPFFAEIGPLVSLLSIVDVSARDNDVTVTAFGGNGAPVPGTRPMTFRLPARGAKLTNVLNLFRFADPLQAGWISVRSTSPVVGALGLGNVAQTGFSIEPALSGLLDSFVFPVRPGSRDFFTSISLVNSATSTNNVTFWLADMLGTQTSTATITVGPSAQTLQSLADLFPEAVRDSYVLVRSQFPVGASLVEGKNDDTQLSHLPALRVPQSFRPRPSETFLTSGRVQINDLPLPGITVELRGPKTDSAITDPAGAYFFGELPPGSYVLRPATDGFVYSPPEIRFDVRDNNVRSNNFNAFLLPPLISAVTPSAVVAGSAGVDITITGSQFFQGAEVLFNGQSVPTTFVNSTTVSARLEASRLLVAHDATIRVANRAPGGTTATSNALLFPVGSRPPVISGISGMPTPLISGHGGFQLTVRGSGFIAGATVDIEGVQRPANLVNSTTLVAQVLQSDLGQGGFLKVTATNPSPTVGPSNSVTMTVLNPIPGILAISPPVAEVRLETNAPPLPLYIDGFRFAPGAVVVIGDQVVPTEFFDADTLLAMVPTTVLQVGGSLSVAIRNPEPAVASSESMALLVNNLPPVLNAVDAGSLTFDPDRPNQRYTAFVTLRGQNFGPNTVVELASPCAGGDVVFNPVSGARMSPSHIVATTTVECAGSYQVRVRTSQPGGGVSSAMSYFVNSLGPQTAPTITSMTPDSVSAGSATFTLTISGSGLQAGAFVNFGSAVIVPTNVTDTAVEVSIPAFLIRNAGLVPVSVTNSNATGTSNRLFFTIR